MQKSEILTDYYSKIKRFNLNSRKIEFKLKPVPVNESHPIKFIQTAIEEIVLYATKDLKPTDQIGITFGCENFKQKAPGYFSFREVSKVKLDDIWVLISSVFQSNSQGLNTDKFCLGVTTVRIPQGRGRVRSYRTFDQECAKRGGIITVKNHDNLCLPRALVVAIAKINNDVHFRKICKDVGKIQRIKALELMKKAGVQILERGGGVEELLKFQTHLSEYQIVVYIYENKGRDLLFKGSNESTKKINLLYHKHHYNVITSLTAAFCCSYFCETCSIPYNTKNRHRCAKSCCCCQQQPPCLKTKNEILCSDCNRNFRGPECFNKHKQSGSFIRGSLCAGVRRCTECLKTIKTDRVHTCGETYCTMCKQTCPEGHLCYIRIDKATPKLNNFLFIFFDLETRQETDMPGTTNSKLHEPNLCVFMQCCNVCINTEKRLCEKCGIRKQVLHSEPIAPFVWHLVEIGRKFKNVTCIAHNSQAFDGQFILKYILEKTDIKPELIMRGTKILLMQIHNIKFIDSLNYFPMSLNKLPKAFDLGAEIKKGYFPHLFNTLENSLYVGPLPAVENYCPDTMRTDDRDRFLKWYEQYKDSEFNMQRDLIAYCTSDVDILKRACLKFRDMFLQECNVCPFTEAVTIASACNKVFRRNFLKPETIGIIPRDGYRLKTNQSKIALQWLIHEAETRNVHIKHAGNGVESIVCGVKVDGYCDETKQVFEFNGCYFHGHTCMHGNRDKPLFKDTADTLNTRLDRTQAKIARLRSMDYEVIDIWECKFREFLFQNKDRKEALGKHPLLMYAKLEPRDAFMGGRTGNTKTYYKTGAGEKIHYIDVCSLYPWVCKYGLFPLGHPAVHVGNEECIKIDLNQIEGLIKCRISTPYNLYHPVLPIKQNNKLLFTLCQTCSDTLNHEDCTHSEFQRSLSGTWVIAEVRKAIEEGYEIKEIFEIWEYECIQYDRQNNIDGLFGTMMNKFLKMKQQASDWPVDCDGIEQKNQYIEGYFEREGILLEFEAISNNPGQRSLAKLMLNSFWGKMGQRENQSQTAIINKPEELYKLLVDPSIAVNTLLPINEDVLVVNWEYIEGASEQLKYANVVIASFVTALARLKLFEFLNLLGERALYYDTDSVIYISRVGDIDPPTGTFLGDMTNELECYGSGSYITEFISLGPKNYGFSVYSPQTNKNSVVCKVKGICINYETSKTVNLDTMRDMILEDRPPVYIMSRNFRRTEDFNVITKSETKVFQPKFTKRRLVAKNDSVPFGFKRNCS